MYITENQLQAALNLRDLSNPDGGTHAMQLLVQGTLDALSAHWDIPVAVERGQAVVSSHDNYDALGYPQDGPSRDARYTRWVDERRLLRTQTSAIIPGALRALNGAQELLIAAPGLVYRRDVIDRTHVGEPHQMDLWRISESVLTKDDLLDMIALVVESLMPGAQWRAIDAVHPYTQPGLEVEVLLHGEWMELLECGLAHPKVLADAGLDGCTGLAMGMGLDRALMLRKNIEDIRVLRSADPRIAKQMLDLETYQPVSMQPPAKRDLSIAITPGFADEEIGDRVRMALGQDAESLEEVLVLSRTPASGLPTVAIERMGMSEDQENLLVRVIIREAARSLPKPEANALRDRVYSALHEGTNSEYALA